MFKIAIAIPTFNRLEKLKICLQQVEKQYTDDRFEIYCVISNIASTDGTAEYLRNLKSEKIKYVISGESCEAGTYFEINLRNLSRSIPVDIDWVWFHGDDDALAQPDAISRIIDLIESSSKKLSVIHACASTRSRNSGKIIKGSLFDICNTIGYHEMLGWMSSLIVRRAQFVNATMQFTEKAIGCNSTEDFHLKKMSAYPHSAAFFKTCASDDAIFIDLPLIGPQDQNQTEESIIRWQKEAVGERYFYIVDDILEMYDSNILIGKLNPVFFRYLNYSLWDRFGQHCITQVLENGSINAREMDNLERIGRIGNMFEDTSERKLFLQWYQGLTSTLTHYLDTIQKLRLAKNGLIESFNLLCLPVYPFEVLKPEQAT